MKRDDVFPSRFLKAADLNGEPLTLTIASAKYETMKNHKGNDEQKLVCGFQKTKKCLTVNVTNFDAIAAVTGEADSDDWLGHKIELFPSEVQVGTEMKACIRIRAPQQPDLALAQKPTGEKPPAKGKADDDMDDTIPF